MIKKLNHKSTSISERIRSVFQAAYAVEAALLKATDFPPLKRSLANFIRSETEFYGFWKDMEIAAVIETQHDNHSTHIQSLVVDPRFFRQGLAQKLITFVFDSFDSKVFTVETGIDNKPAIELYKKFAFKEVKQWDTDHGIRKIRFEKKIKNQA